MSADVSGESPVCSDATRLKRSLCGFVCHAAEFLRYFALLVTRMFVQGQEKNAGWVRRNRGPEGNPRSLRE